MLAGRMIASEELIFGSNVDATAMYDFVPTTRLKGNEEFIEETEFYDRYEGGLVEASDAVPIDVRPERHLVFPALLNAYGEKKVAVVRKRLHELRFPQRYSLKTHSVVLNDETMVIN